jgi:hypothetical protein
MGLPQFVQRLIALRDAGADPGLIAIAARTGAGFDHGSKGKVAGNFEGPAAQHLGKGVRAVEMIQRQDRPSPRLDPEDIRIVARVSHRENPAAIGEQQQLRIDRR